MLEQALKEVTSAEAKREINCALIVIREMRKIIKADPVRVDYTLNEDKPTRKYRKSKHRGVYPTPYGKTWMVKIKGKHLGTFATEELAVEAAEEYRRINHG